MKKKVTIMATKRSRGTRPTCFTFNKYIHISRAVFQSSRGELRGSSLFFPTTVFYIQTNEGAGRKIMRDGVREGEKRDTDTNERGVRL